MNGRAFGALLKNVQRLFTVFSHVLITAKLNAYRFSLNVLKLINNSHKENKELK